MLDPEHPTAQAVSELARGAGSRLVTVRYDAGDETGAAAAVAELAGQHNIDRLDIVVANAGIATHWPAVKDVTRAAALEHVTVNALGALALYQATRGLLQKSSARPIFAAVGSAASALGYVIFPFFFSFFFPLSESVVREEEGKMKFTDSRARTHACPNHIRQQPPVPNGAYGPSKAMLNWYSVRINAEEDWLNAFVLDPGWVPTDMGNRAAEAWGMGAAPVPLDDSVVGMFKVLTTATKERYGGKFVVYTGKIRGW